ncbi:MAG: phosphoribosylanthranilate isomerase, partial [Gemmatimonadaceae bacterium]
MTRAEDVRAAVGLGATYLGVIFAGGPRSIDPDTAATILAMAGSATRRVGVFGQETAAAISAACRTAGLDIIQLHADPTPDRVVEVRAVSGRQIWAAVRVRDGELPDMYADLLGLADAIVLDAVV